jgi:alkanesulfonate monooxygenase SsuD/methylene tetrahydromethanopterin reductase-like flavin-dependent oxidoreductase (luciferase family)
MRFGIEIAPWGELADPRVLADLAGIAEDEGWDGVFLWDAMLHDAQGLPKADPWVALAAIAVRTRRIRIGTMVTPIPRRRPWKLARETVTLDHLSDGRVTLGVGLGDPSLEEFQWFGETGTDHRIRARMLDEGLAILDGLWTGKPFAFAGEHYRLHKMTFLPRPVQRPRIPVWVGGWWPNTAPFRRAARWDGAYPGRTDGPISPEDVTAVVAYIRDVSDRESPFDVVVGDRPGEVPTDAINERVHRLGQAGATWWLDKAGVQSANSLEERLRMGPPKL